MRILIRWAVRAAAVAALFAGIVAVQHRLTEQKPPGWLEERMSYLPRSDVLKPLLLGFHTTYANYLWFRTVNYFGSHYVTDRSYPWLVQMVDMITRLNPQFEPAYEFAGVMVPDLCHAPDAARVMLERGISHIGERSWKVYFYSGFIYFKYYGDKKTAADYWAMGARVPSDQDWKLARMAATFYAQSGQQQTAESFLLFLLETTDSPAVKRVIKEKLDGFLRGAGKIPAVPESGRVSGTGS